MQTFKKVSIFVVLNIVVISLCTLMFAHPSTVKVLLKQSYSSEYDTLIVGQSHAETSIDPFLLSSETELNAFNLSRRLMPVSDLYFLLCEANKNNNYKTVILDIDSSYWTQEDNIGAGDDTNLLFKLTGKRRLEYFKMLSDTNYNNLFDYTVSPDKIVNIPKNLKCKLNKAYITCDDSSIINTNKITGVGENFEYRGRGFRYGMKKSGVVWKNKNFDANAVTKESIKTFEKIAKYCEENDIQLICVQSALPPQRLQNENLNDVHDFFTQLCDSYSVPFYDMNYLKPEYLSQCDDDFVDIDGHMLGQLAERHTHALSCVLSSNNKSEFFFDDYKDVLSGLNQDTSKSVEEKQ